jgi:hypothetical protein
VAYGLANILAVIPITPSGLGVVEGVLIPTLVGFHVTKTIAILGVLSYRLVNFWLPIPAGGACYLSLRFGREGKEHRQERARVNGNGGDYGNGGGKGDGNGTGNRGGDGDGSSTRMGTAPGRAAGWLRRGGGNQP